MLENLVLYFNIIKNKGLKKLIAAALFIFAFFWLLSNISVSICFLLFYYTNNEIFTYLASKVFSASLLNTLLPSCKLYLTEFMSFGGIVFTDISTKIVNIFSKMQIFEHLFLFLVYLLKEIVSFFTNINFCGTGSIFKAVYKLFDGRVPLSITRTRARFLAIPAENTVGDFLRDKYKSIKLMDMVSKKRYLEFIKSKPSTAYMLYKPMSVSSGGNIHFI
jgi:hypothetical protein